MAMYALPTDPSELKAFTSRTQKAGTQQHASIADVAGANFSKGDIRFPFMVSGNRWWIPAKSYVRIRADILRGDGSKILPGSQIAPAMGFAASLFQSAEMQIRGVTVSRQTDFVPQIDQYVKRTATSAAFMQQVLNSMETQDPSWEERRRKWDLPAPGEGVLQTHYYNVTDLAQDPQTMNLTKMLIQLVPAVIMAGVVTTPPLIVFDNNGMVGIETGWNLQTILQPGDRLYFNGGGGLGGGGNPQNATFAVTIGSFNVQAGTSITYNLVADSDVLAAAGANLVSVQDLEVSRDVQEADQQIEATSFEITWQPSLSIFGLSHALPSMSAELILKGRPGARYGLAAVNTRPALNNSPAAPTVDVIPFDQISVANQGKYCVRIRDIFFYTYQVESDRLTDGTYLLDLEECTCSSQILDQTIGLNQKSFLVAPSTYQLGVAFQDNSAGVSTDKPIGYFGWQNFIPGVLGVAPPAGFPGIFSTHKDLFRLYMQYSNMTFPQPDADPTYNYYPVTSGNQNDFTEFYTQRWMESALHSGQFWAPGGPEAKQEWWDKGPIHIFPTLRDPVDRSTNVVVNAYFAKAPVNACILLFSMSRKVATIMVANGQVQQVDVQDQ